MNHEIDEATEFLNNNILEFSEVQAHKELHELSLWCEDELCGGAALHIIIEDGNYNDSSVDYCLNYMESGEWGKDCAEHGYSYSDDDNKKMLRVLELMKPLSEEKREMVMEGKTITEELFDLLYSLALKGDK